MRLKDMHHKATNSGKEKRTTGAMKIDRGLVNTS
jgi:hypothetical protein